MQNPTIVKRVVIISLFILLFSLTGYIIYFITAPEPTCFDKKQNQAEKGIDCGGTCQPCKEDIQTQDIVIKEVAVALGGNNTYDVVAKIANPNNTLGASVLQYTFILKDAAENVIATKEGTTFILPADSKYVPELGLQAENGAVPTKVELVVGEIKWEKLNDTGKPQIGVYNKNFSESATGNGGEARGVIRNENSYNLNKIFVTIILRSENGDIIGINKTEKNTVRAKEERDFVLTWPYALTASVQNIEVDTESNVFDPQNFSFPVR
ncbi:MAG: hypothetical protein US57_C0017G0002 [Candidatus Moranbacteria bacterium GW2011_GWC2_37_73]|nr:MAG: hypothetical protein UR95_C0006G0191 [Parcubacteria group bacterium GW2011_GWC1_36_108]KKQ00296.1 MAG: hypothetical protein US09_C0015G0012 [Candidatus Moranbacteria bacterium GW2011_GWD1_36_198]KKQ00719.1 MAG: hypothetical protein US10_C0027G0002 [Candidatus Moranbacteria bacterium GW2011_GWD2_36_198]KKQ39203.1 MAG: hypothetical protein US57_C0017G0002 [Candidatus Moranbacteria bacterium GW2011_GWC2_37_73]HAS00027.1 hypothetical protein [Candidatus Moranbacteria bacterium]